MFVLVLFTDEVYLICTPKDISSFKTRCPPVKYTDGRKYTARIIAVHEDRQLLEDIQRSLNSAVYCIKLPNLKYTGECLTYRKVVDHLKGSQDVNKLYLDPSVVLSPGKTEENYVLSLKGKKITKAYFDKQPNLVEMEIKTADVNEACSFYNAKEVIRVSPITVQAKSATCDGKNPEKSTRFKNGDYFKTKL